MDERTRQKWDTASRSMDLFAFGDERRLGPHKRGEIKAVENMVDAMHSACQFWEAGRKSDIAQMLANGGELHGVRLLSPETVRRASEVQNRGIGRVIPFPMHWRLGYHRVPTIRTRVRAGFGHFGFGGSGAWADPERNLSVALVVNSGTGTPFGDLRMVRIGSTAARCAERR